MIEERSIAVLPFDNISSDPENEYFADGMTEELINALSKIEGLKVTARTSSFAYKGQKVDVRHVGNDLGVSTVLEGSVRKSREQVRITAQLIRTDNGFHIWSESFDRQLDNIFELQDEISLLIADKIRENFGHLHLSERLVEPSTQKVNAYEQYLKGRFYQLKWDNDGFDKAIACYERSIALDSNYPMPYLAASQTFAYSSAWNFMPRDEGYQQAVAYLKRVSPQHHDLPEYQFTHSTKAMWLDWDWQTAHAGLLKTLEGNPGFSEAIEAMAELYYAVGDFDRGLDYINRALKINPLSPNHHFTRGIMRYLSGQVEEALTNFERSIELDPNWVLSLQLKGSCLVLLGDWEGLVQLLPSLEFDWERNNFRQLYALLHGTEPVTVKVSEQDDLGYLTWPVYLLLHGGETEAALDKLTWAVKERLGQYIGFACDPLLAPLFPHPRFQALVVEAKGDMDWDAPPPVQVTGNSEDKLTTDESGHYVQALETIMNGERPHLNASLTLRELAGVLGLHPNKLSWLLNEKLGKNFNEFVNLYRLQEFQQRALDPANSHLTLLGLAYDSGFNSKSVFNEFFKKSTGSTPKAWVKAQR